MITSLKQLDLNIDKGMMSGAGVFAPRTLVITTFVLFTYITIEFSSNLFCPNDIWPKTICSNGIGSYNFEYNDD